jgi:hypothetical protein
MRNWPWARSPVTVPDYDADRYQDETYRSNLGTYYGPYWP